MKTVLQISFLFATLAVANAAPILPISYTVSSSTGVGAYPYHDESGNQLIDGAYGTAPYYADLGAGPAYEWLGWGFDLRVNLDFAFDDLFSFESVKVGTVQYQALDAMIPNVYLYSSLDGIAWTFQSSVLTPPSATNDNSYLSLFMPVSFDANFVRVTLENNQPWMFVDEVDFEGVRVGGPGETVPERGGSGLLAFAGLSGMLAMRRFFPWRA